QQPPGFGGVETQPPAASHTVPGAPTIPPAWAHSPGGSSSQANGAPVAGLRTLQHWNVVGVQLVDRPSAPSTADTQSSSTIGSIAWASPAVGQPPLASSDDHVDANAVSALVRHFGSGDTLLAAAFAAHFSLAEAFLPAARSLPLRHLFGSTTDPSAPAISLTQALMLASAAGASPVVAPPPVASVLAKAVASTSSALPTQFGSTRRPVAAALA